MGVLFGVGVRNGAFGRCGCCLAGWVVRRDVGFVGRGKVGGVGWEGAGEGVEKEGK